MSDHQDPHTGLHSEQGGLAGEHPGRAANPSSRCTTWRGWSSRSRTWTGRRGSPRPSGSARRYGPPTSCTCAVPTRVRRAC